MVPPLPLTKVRHKIGPHLTKVKTFVGDDHRGSFLPLRTRWLIRLAFKQDPALTNRAAAFGGRFMKEDPTSPRRLTFARGAPIPVHAESFLIHAVVRGQSPMSRPLSSV